MTDLGNKRSDTCNQAVIREIQQQLNAHYGAYIGMLPADDICGREMNQAMIKVLQIIQGHSAAAVTGILDERTKAGIPILPDAHNHLSPGQRQEAVNLLRYLLNCNGYHLPITGSWNTQLAEAITCFQQEHALPVTGIADVNTWMSLLNSKGNPNRHALACDCATILNSVKAQDLYAAGYRYVGRYLSGTVSAGVASKAMTPSEMQAIFNACMRIFAIFQEGRAAVNYFTYRQGTADGIKAMNAAKMLGIPRGEIIYFAVDYDVLEDQITTNIYPYFKGIRDTIKKAKNYYSIGIYAPRNVCSKVSAIGLACSSFVAGMSTGYSGNIGYRLPCNWAFNQFHEYTFKSSDGDFALDKDAYSGRYSGFGHVILPYCVPQNKQTQ